MTVISEKQKWSRAQALESERDLVMVIIIVGAVVTTIIIVSAFSIQDFPGLCQYLDPRCHGVSSPPPHKLSSGSGIVASEDSLRSS